MIDKPLSKYRIVPIDNGCGGDDYRVEQRQANGRWEYFAGDYQSKNKARIELNKKAFNIRNDAIEEYDQYGNRL